MPPSKLVIVELGVRTEENRNSAHHVVILEPSFCTYEDHLSLLMAVISTAPSVLFLSSGGV